MAILTPPSRVTHSPGEAVEIETQTDAKMKGPEHKYKPSTPLKDRPTQATPESHDNSELCEFVARATELRPPVTSEEYEFRALAHSLHPNLRNKWDTFRLRTDKYIPCHSQYLKVELQSEHTYWAVTDIAHVMGSFAFLPLYFGYFDFNFKVIFAFLLNRVAIPGMIVVVRTRESLRADRRALFALDMTAWYTCLGGMYGEVGTVIEMVGWDMFDDTVQRYEEDMWGSQPAQTFQEKVPNKLIGEYFHWCYFIFYLIMFLPLPVTYWGYSRDKYLAVATAQTLTIIICSIIWLYFPCEGPYWTLGAKEPDEVGYFMPYIVQFLVEGGSSRGTAMPSSHCGVSSACWLAVVWETKDYQLPFLLVTPGLWLATIYGTFHYVFDSVVGIIIGVFSVFIGRFVTRILTHYFSTNAGISIDTSGSQSSVEGTKVEKTPLRDQRLLSTSSGEARRDAVPTQWHSSTSEAIRDAAPTQL